MTGTRQPYIRIQFFIKRKEGMTSEEFHEYWEKVHGDFCLALSGFKHVVKRYTQFHTTPEYQAKAAVLGLPTLDFDGTSEMWVESVEEYGKYVTQEDVLAALSKDEGMFVGPGLHVMIGYEYLAHGEPVAGLPADEHFRLE